MLIKPEQLCSVHGLWFDDCNYVFPGSDVSVDVVAARDIYTHTHTYAYVYVYVYVFYTYIYMYLSLSLYLSRGSYGAQALPPPGGQVDRHRRVQEGEEGLRALPGRRLW